MASKLLILCIDDAWKTPIILLSSHINLPLEVVWNR